MRMIATFSARASLLGLALIVSLCGPASAQSVIVENVAFDTNLPPRRSPTMQAVRLQARLYLPAERTSPVAAMVVASSSGGVRVEREIFYAETLARQGIAALVIDSFRPRGVQETSTNQRRVSLWQMENDAFAGLKYLKADPRIRSDKVGVMGVSKGGGVALQSQFLVRQRWRGLGALAFAAHVAIVPSCNLVHRTRATTGAPLLMLLAGLDQQTPPKPCQKLAEQLKADKHPDVTAKIYEGAYHAWETAAARPITNPRAENYSRCQGVIEDDGWVALGPKGVRVRGSEVVAWMRLNCMKRGAVCCAGTDRQRQDAAADIVAFLRDRGL